MGWSKIGAVNAHSARIPENKIPFSSEFTQNA
jgi:hypothetical protein